jgi:hypothetical protein
VNDLKHIYNACDPFVPATEEDYYDCSEARGSGSLTLEFQRHLGLAEDYLSFLFSGHLGCGKSSELRNLERVLEAYAPGRPCCFPVYVDASEYLDDYDVATVDILLAIVTELASALREELGIELKDDYFAKRVDEIKAYFLSPAEINEGELSLGFAKAKIQRLKKDPTARQNVRKVLEPKMATMVEEINTVLDKARLQLANAAPRYKDLVFIVDNLEKIRRVAGMEEGRASLRELFVERYTQLTGMKAHFIYTVPLPLVRSSDAPILESWYGTLFVLPMVKIVRRGTREPFDAGIESLRALVQKRIAPLNLDEAFQNEALQFLVTYSGGIVRDLMAFIQESCTHVNGLPITLGAAHRAVQPRVRTFSTSVPEDHWEKLAKLDLSPDQKIPNNDPDHLTMLENLTALEYRNGDDEGSPFAPAEPWYAVNPIVRELEKFKAARSRLAAIEPKSAPPDSPQT